MMTFLRWLGRTLFALLILALLAGVWISWTFQQWKKEKLAALDAGSKVVKTAAGLVEYAERGSGPAVLICHGAPGGYDQGMVIGEALAEAGFRVIAPSRPGFLRTPLTTGLLFDDQADALAALLDTLGVKTASVLGFSTGAQTAVSFAIRHADRTNALALLSPLTAAYQRDPKIYPRPILTEAALFKTTGDMGSWMLVKQSEKNPRSSLETVVAVDTTLSGVAREKLVDFVLKDSAQLALFRGLVGAQAPLSPRESGTRNDLLLARALEPIAYEKIHAPTLLVNGTAAADAPWTSLKPITDKLSSARTIKVGNTGELVWFGPDAATLQKTLVDFLRQPPSVSTPTPAPAPN